MDDRKQWRLTLGFHSVSGSATKAAGCAAITVAKLCTGTPASNRPCTAAETRSVVRSCSGPLTLTLPLVHASSPADIMLCCSAHTMLLSSLPRFKCCCSAPSLLRALLRPAGLPSASLCAADSAE